jgi:predicted kinase
VLLRSDEVRKELAGIPASTSAAAPLMRGVHSRTMTSLTYGALLRRARALLQRGESVILDATWADTTWREEAWRVAKLADSDLVQLRCEVPVDVATARARQRQGNASGAGPEITVAVAGEFTPWPAATAIDTNGPPEEAVARALRAVSPPQASAIPA